MPGGQPGGVDADRIMKRQGNGGSADNAEWPPSWEDPDSDFSKRRCLLGAEGGGMLLLILLTLLNPAKLHRYR